MLILQSIKGIVSDSNNIFLWHEWDVNQKKLISKISFDSNFTFLSYVWLCGFIAPIDYCVE